MTFDDWFTFLKIIFCILVLLGIRSLYHQIEISRTEDYVRTVVPLLEAEKQRTGQYFLNLDSLPSIPKTPRAYLSDGYYYSDGKTYRFGIRSEMIEFRSDYRRWSIVN